MGKILDFIGEVLEEVAERENQSKRNMMSCLRGCTFDSSRLEMAKGMVNSKTVLTSEDVKDMMSTFTFDERKVDLAKYAWNKVIDPYNFYKVCDALTFSFSKKEVMWYTNNHPRY